MKPTKNRMFCRDCGKTKMLFPTEEKADTFIRFNSKEIEEQNGEAPSRSYFCIACNGWHTTHREFIVPIASRTERIVAAYQQETASTNTGKFAEAEALLNQICKLLKADDHEACTNLLNLVQQIILGFIPAEERRNRGQEIIYRYNSYTLKLNRKIELLYLSQQVMPTKLLIKEKLYATERFLEKGNYEQSELSLTQAYELSEKIEVPNHKANVLNKLNKVSTKLNIKKGIEHVEAMEAPHAKVLINEIGIMLRGISVLYCGGKLSECIPMLKNVYRLSVLISPNEEYEDDRTYIQKELKYWVERVEVGLKELQEN